MPAYHSIKFGKPSILRRALCAFTCWLCLTGQAHTAESPKEEAERAKAALDLRIYQSTADALVAQREAETRRAIAEAERAELLARLPPSTSRPLTGSTDTAHFGVAGLAKAFDLAQDLAREVCAALPANSTVTLYEPASTQGVVAARTVSDSIDRTARDLAVQNQELQRVIDLHGTTSTISGGLTPLLLTVVPATVKAAADIAGLFKSNVAVSGTDYGSGTRALFATALAQACPLSIVGLGSGYLGEMDLAQHTRLVEKVHDLAVLRGAYAQRIGVVGRLADLAKGEQKKQLAAMETTAIGVLKMVDAFVESLKAGEISDKSPLYNTARYLDYAERTAQALVLDFDLRLEGMTLLNDRWFSGQRLRLSSVAFLWYRLHEPNGAVRLARAMRKMTAPVEIDLRGQAVDQTFWTPPALEISKPLAQPAR